MEESIDGGQRTCPFSQNNKKNVCDHVKASFLAETQLTFSCSKSTKEILEKGVKYVQS